jgi:hypothetical protein
MPFERLHGRDSRMRNETAQTSANTSSVGPAGLCRSAQSGPAQPLQKTLPRAFGGSLISPSSSGVSLVGRGLGAEAGFRLFAERQTGFWSGLSAVSAHLRNRLDPGQVSDCCA